MKQPFTSIQYPIAIDAPLGRLEEETNYDNHVTQLIRQVLFTGPGERVNRPDFGCGVKRLVFAPNSDVSASLAQVSIYEALSRWLGSVITVENVTAQASNEILQIQIAYVVKVRQERRFLNLEVTA